MDVLEAQEEVCLDGITANEDTYTLSITVSKDRFWEWLRLFECMSCLSGSLYRQRRRAEEADKRKSEAYQEGLRQRDEAILAQMRARYKDVYQGNEREALKVITSEFKPYWWLKPKFREEVRIQRELEVIRLSKRGFTSKEISAKVGLHSGTVRKILSKE